jgi:hypothetical protein
MTRTPKEIFDLLRSNGVASADELFPLLAIAYVLTGGDESYASGGAIGMFQIDPTYHGNVPADVPGQIAIARNVLTENKTNFLSGLTFPGSDATRLKEFLSIVVLGWRYPSDVQGSIQSNGGATFKAVLDGATNIPSSESSIYASVCALVDGNASLFKGSFGPFAVLFSRPWKWWQWGLFGGGALLGVWYVSKHVGK